MTAQNIRLKDNRNLSYAEYGIPNGIPVFILHGTPGSRFLPEDDILLGQSLGIRMIVPERPGFGLSDFQPDRTSLDWPDDITALADHLGIERFGIIGLSGGGPYALACAYKIPQRLTGVAVAGSPAPYNAFGEPSKIPTLEEMQEYAENDAKRVKNDPDEFYEEIVASCGEADREALSLPTVREWLLTTYRETFRNGTQGMVHELMMLYISPWGFPLDAITSDVQLWYGDEDTSLTHGQFLAELIPNSQLHILAGQGHFAPESIEEAFKIFVGKSPENSREE